MSPRFFTLLVVFLLVGIGISRAPVHAAVPADHYVAEMPFLEQDTPIIQVKINDKITANFLVDTGATYSAITPEAAAKLGATKSTGVVDGKAIQEGGKSTHLITTTSFRIGIIDFTGQPLVVTHFLHSGKGDASFDGFIGMDLLAYMAVLFDFPHQKICFYVPSGVPLSLISQLDPKKAISMPVSDPNHNHHLWLDLTLTNGMHHETEHAALDTGNIVTVISTEVARRLDLKPREQSPFSLATGTYLRFETSVSSLRWGDVTLPDQIVSYSTAPASLYPSFLGRDILSKYLVLVDYSAQRVYLQPSLALSFTQIPAAR